MTIAENLRHLNPLERQRRREAGSHSFPSARFRAKGLDPRRAE